MIKIQCNTFEEFQSEFEFSNGQDTIENREYIKNNWKNFIEDEEAFIEEIIHNAENSLSYARVVNDNRGEKYIYNESGEIEIGNFSFLTDVTI